MHRGPTTSKARLVTQPLTLTDLNLSTPVREAENTTSSLFRFSSDTKHLHVFSLEKQVLREPGTA